MHLKEANGKANWTNEKGDEMRKRFSCQWRQLGLTMFSNVTKTCWDRPFKSRDSWCAGAASNSWWVTSSCSPRLAGSTQLGASGRCDADLFEDSEVNTLQRKSYLCIPFPGIVQPQSQFPHSCVCEWFIYSQDRSTYFLQQNKQIDHGNI